MTRHTKTVRISAGEDAVLATAAERLGVGTSTFLREVGVAVAAQLVTSGLPRRVSLIVAREAGHDGAKVATRAARRDLSEPQPNREKNDDA